MGNNKSDGQLPEELLGMLGIMFLPVICAFFAPVFDLLMPAVLFLRHADIFRLYYWGLGAGMLGCGLLFFARLPLYRQRRFFTVGPKALDRGHRRVYWLAYGVLFVSVVLLMAVCGRLR